tara:strand:- start:8679 stop:9110 length:432 start_codon:yes stop_codon:yes gene_type:complete
MSFETCNDLFGSGLFIKLENDGDSIAFIIVAEPFSQEQIGAYGKKRRALFPVMTADGLQLWGVGVKLYRSVEENWKTLRGKAIKLVRHGEAKNPATRYEIKPLKKAPVAVTSAFKGMKPSDVDELEKMVKGFAGSIDSDPTAF